ncbi:hypothetical protein ADL06_22540 [Streptomyces sp. NRRL F-6491]|nr:hypothetical protein ADL06_22540 [Streptomyces sp. NRRL F-6491]KOX42728.1 hypothetical protein ADL08_15300 [Streptomyces sp. NRRL F-6492]
MDRIAAGAGFGTGTAMRRHFREVPGASPRVPRRVPGDGLSGTRAATPPDGKGHARAALDGP